MKFLGYFKEQSLDPAGYRNALAVWYAPGKSNTGYFCYSAIGQHSECSRLYVDTLPRLTRDQAIKLDYTTVREVENLYPLLSSAPVYP